MFASGGYKAVVGTVLPMSDLPRAHEMIHERRHFGLHPAIDIINHSARNRANPPSSGRRIFNHNTASSRTSICQFHPILLLLCGMFGAEFLDLFLCQGKGLVVFSFASGIAYLLEMFSQHGCASEDRHDDTSDDDQLAHGSDQVCFSDWTVGLDPVTLFARTGHRLRMNMITKL